MKFLGTSDNHRGYSSRTHRIHERWAEDLKKETWDVTLLAGDMASHDKRQFYTSLKFWRNLSGEKRIALVRGNHDLWSYGQRNLHSLRNILHHEWFAELDIHHLESAGPLYVGDAYAIVGWDGWYCFRPHTNDMMWINQHVEGDTWRWLQAEAWRGFQDALLSAEDAKKEGRKVIAMTHMPIHPNPSQAPWGGNQGWWEHIAPHINVLLYGHTHRFHDEVIDGVRVINTGSDYDKPKHLIFEL